MAESRGQTHSEIGSGLASIDKAIEVVRVHWVGLMSRYIVAAGPLIVAFWLWIDAVVAQDRRSLGPLSLLVTLALVWRWGGVTFMQAWVMRKIGLAGEVGVWRRLPVVVLARLYANLGITWGGIIILPGLWGLYGSGMAGPVLLRRAQPAWRALRELGSLFFNSWTVLARHASAVSVLTFVAFINLMIVQGVMASEVFPSLVGVDTTDLQWTMSGLAWWVSSVFFLWLAFDAFWAVESVLLLDQLRARRTGSDLKARLAALEGAVA